MLPSLTLEATGRPLRTKLLHGVSSTALKSYHLLLMKFISLIGALSTPGQWPAGPMQAWALRRMGVKCSSRQVWIGPRISIDNPSCLELGARVVIGPDSRLTAYTRIEIGDDFLSAPGLYINTGAHDVRTLAPTFAPVVIGVCQLESGPPLEFAPGLKSATGQPSGPGHWCSTIYRHTIWRWGSPASRSRRFRKPNAGGPTSGASLRPDELTVPRRLPPPGSGSYRLRSSGLGKTSPLSS